MNKKHNRAKKVTQSYIKGMCSALQGKSSFGYFSKFKSSEFDWLANLHLVKANG